MSQKLSTEIKQANEPLTDDHATLTHLAEEHSELLQLPQTRHMQIL